MKKKRGRIFYIIIFIILLPLILLELLFKGIIKLFNKKRRKNVKFSDKEFYDCLNIEKVDIMDGVAFEQFLKRLFIYRGYNVSETARTGDFGADLLLKKDGRSTVVQAKRYNNNVGAKALQEIYSARHHYKADEMMVVSNAHFTKQAQVMAEEQNIELIDREELIGIMNETRDELKEQFQYLPDFMDADTSGNFINENFKYRI